MCLVENYMEKNSIWLEICPAGQKLVTIKNEMCLETSNMNVFLQICLIRLNKGTDKGVGMVTNQPSNRSNRLGVHKHEAVSCA